MAPLLRQVQQTIADHQMIGRGHTVLVAVSGGADSMVLLHVLWQLCGPLALRLCVAHLNHQMRPEAMQDAHFVETAACHLGLRCISGTGDVPAYQRQHKLSPEEAARQVRYAFLQATATQLGADRIAVGHTADDQAETLLFRLLRGSGLRGLGGIPPVRGAIVRPLIRVSRADILTYAQTHQLQFRADPSNAQRRYTRNRIRLDLLPALGAHYNPRLLPTLCRTAQLLADDEAALQATARQHFLVARQPASEPGALSVRVATLACLPLALQRRVVREALTEVSGGLQGMTSRHIAAILALLRSGTGSKRLGLPRGVVVERRYAELLIHRQAPVPTVDVEVPLPVPGACRIATLGVTVISEQLPRHALAGPCPSGDVTWLDADKVGQDVHIRTRRAGDRLQPLGSAHAKKLKDFLIDAKVPRAVRDRLPLVVSGSAIAWVGGVRPAEWAKVTPATQTILRLQLCRQAPGGAVGTALEQT
jgi:tRNA(Ile)-lysidine synthase